MTTEDTFEVTSDVVSAAAGVELTTLAVEEVLAVVLGRADYTYQPAGVVRKEKAHRAGIISISIAA